MCYFDNPCPADAACEEYFRGTRCRCPHGKGEHRCERKLRIFYESNNTDIYNIVTINMLMVCLPFTFPSTLTYCSANFPKELYENEDIWAWDPKKFQFRSDTVC